MILECGHCGAPLDVKESARITKCRYCGTSNERTRMRTLAERTPPDFVPPRVWVPPPTAPADSNVELKYKRSSGPGCAALFGVLLVASIAVAVIALLRSGGVGGAAKAAKLGEISLEGTHEAWCDKTSASVMEDWCIVYVRTGRYEFFNVIWDKAHRDHASSFVLSINGKAPDDGARDRISAALHGGLDENGSWSFPGIRVNVSGASLSATAEPDAHLQWKKQLDAVWRIVVAATLGMGKAPSEAETREYLGGGYPVAGLAKIDPKVGIDRAEAAVRAVFAGAAREKSDDVSMHVGLEHPLFRTAKLDWRNQRDAVLANVSLWPTAAYGARRKDFATCAAKQSGGVLKVQETDYLKGKADYYVTVGNTSMYASEHHLSIYASDGIDPAAWKKIVAAIDACR